MSKQIIIARYGENIDWTKELTQDYIIYDKTPNATPTPNTILIQNHKTGREAHTMLYHIINNYFQLADQTTFLQGDPSPHFFTNYHSMIEDLNSDYPALFRPHGIIRVMQKEDIINYRVNQICNIFDNFLHIGVPNTFIWTWGAQFTIHKNIISLKPLSLYKQLYNMIIESKINAYTMETMWMNVFAPDDNYYKPQYWKEIFEYGDSCKLEFPEKYSNLPQQETENTSS
jgi:hypothetical protein